MEGPYFYVIYDPADLKRVLKFCAGLEKQGIRCWLRDRDAGGRTDPDVYKNALKYAGGVILYTTKGKGISDVVRFETEYARSHGLRLMICAEKGALPKELKNRPRFPGANMYLTGPTPEDVEIYDTDSIGRALMPYGSRPPEKKAPERRSLLERLGLKKKHGERDKEKGRKERGASKANFSVISPKAARPDDQGVIDLYMYTEKQRSVVEKALEQADGLVRETKKEGFEVARRTIVTARLESDDAQIRDPEETQTWNGEALHFDFRFHIAPDCSRSQAAFTLYIAFNGIPVTRLNFIVAVTGRAAPGTIPAKVTRNDYEKAFISYSRKDEQRMLARVLGIRDLMPEMRFWLDKQSMDAGDLWRDEIKKAIRLSDVLLLFWSVAASRSREVENEWRYALTEKGLRFISPVPLDPPEDCPPPEDLGDLNFNVHAFSDNEITRKLTFFDCGNILDVSESELKQP